MPNVFQQLAEKVRQLSKENAELKANKEPSMEQLAKYGKLQQENEERKRKNIKAEKLLKQADNDIRKLLGELKTVELYSQGFQNNCIEKLKEKNKQLSAQVKEYEQTCQQLLSEVMESPPKYETLGGVGKEDIKPYPINQMEHCYIFNSYKAMVVIQALVRGYLMRKLMCCCVCYEPTKTKNKCCNSYLCEVCRPRCNGQCPICRQRFPINLNFNTNMILAPTPNQGLRIVSWRTSGFDPHIAIVHYPPRIYNTHRTREEIHQYNHQRNTQRERYNNLTFDQIPATHRFNMFDTQENGWGCELLTFLRKHRLYEDPEPHQEPNYLRRIHGRSIAIYIGEESRIRWEVLGEARTCREWSQTANCPLLQRINYNNNTVRDTHEYPLGSSNGFSQDFLNNNPNAKGNTNSARLKRVWHKILQMSVEMKTEENNHMNWRYFMIKNRRSHRYSYYIMRMRDDPQVEGNLFDMSEDEDE